MDFFSARLLFVIVVDDGRPRKKNRYDDSVIVFRARDSAQALAKALEIGRSHETTYKNANGQTVRWALIEVVNLDWIGTKVDGKEVASGLHYRVSQTAIPPVASSGLNARSHKGVFDPRWLASSERSNSDTE